MKKYSEIGIDIVDIDRFKKFSKDRKNNFLIKTFTKYEIEYCFFFKDVEVHLAGIFAAKESVSKALGVKKFPFVEIEIKHSKEGKPLAYKSGKKLLVSISIAHTNSVATAIALA